MIWKLQNLIQLQQYCAYLNLSNNVGIKLFRSRLTSNLHVVSSTTFHNCISSVNCIRSTEMSLTQGCLRVFLCIQNYLKPPFQMDPFTLHQHCREFFLPLSDNFLKNLTLWQVVKKNVCILMLFSLGRGIWLFSKRKDSDYSFEEHGFYVLMYAVLVIGWAAYNALDVHIPELCFAINQRFKLVPTQILGWPFISNGRRRPMLGEAFIYCFSVGFLAFPIFFTAIPIFRDYCPIQLLVSTFLLEKSLYVSIFTKLVGSALLGFTALYGGAVVLVGFLEVFMFVEAVQILSFTLFLGLPIRTFQVPCYQGSLELRVLISHNFKFRERLALFRQLEVLIRVGNNITSEFLAVLVGMGVLASGWAGYVTVMCYSVFPLVIYLSCSAFFFICLTINFLLIYLAALPYRNGETFKCTFKYLIGYREKFEWLKLKACPSIAYEIGSVVRKVQFSTALSIANAIVNLAATLVLMQI